MSLRPAVLGLLAALIWGGAAGAQELPPDLLTDARACAASSDGPVCLLAVVATADSERLRQDLELRAHPELLTAASVDPYKPFPHNPDNPDKIADQAAEAVLERLRGGDSVDAALNPMAALPLPEVRQFASPRVRAYRRLWTLHHAHVPVASSPELARAVLARWEAELLNNARSDAATDPPALAEAYMAFGDRAGASRVIELGGPLTDQARIDRLRAAGRLEEAAALAVKADVALDETRLREDFELYDAPGLAGQDELNARLRLHLRGALDQMRAEGKLKQAAEFESRAGSLLEVQPSRLAAGRAEIPLYAWGYLNQSRAWLVEALLKVGSRSLAQQVADAILKAPLGSLQLWDFNVVLNAASPPVAEAWLVRMEAALVAGELPDDEHQQRLADRATMVLLGWSAMKRPDRADLAFRYWLPLAEAEVAGRKAGGHMATPYTDAITAFLLNQDRADEARGLFYDYKGAARRLANDIARGRGLARMDAYLTGPDDLAYVIGECGQAAGRQLRIDVGEACIERGAGMEDQYDRRLLVNTALNLSHDAARADRLAEARRLYAKALDLHASVNDPRRVSHWGVVRTLHELAKAELRADGRLPVRKEAL